MGGMWGSRERVEERLSGLRVVYGSFPLDQTTLTVPEKRFERLRDWGANNLVEVRVEVHKDDGEVLHVADGEGRRLPSTGVGAGEKIEERARRAVREQTGVECAVEDLSRATIAGVRNASQPDAGTLYFLVAVLEGRKQGGTAAEFAEWEPDSARRRPLQSL